MCDSRDRHIIPIMNHCSLPIQFTLLVALNKQSVIFESGK